MVLVALGVLAGRLVQLQGLDSRSYAAMAEKQRLVTIPLLAPRGQITDRNGQPFAVTVDARDIVADPTLIKDTTAAAQQLAGVLSLPVAGVEAALSRPGRFSYVDKGVTPDVGRAVMALNLPGIYAVAVKKRVYPGGVLASNVVGFVGADGQGLGGIEYSMNKVLAGTDGRRTFENGHNGRPIPDGLDIVRNAVPGTGVRLTLDRDIQWEAQQAIAAQVAKTGAKSGTVIVMNPRNGQLLALATAPGFDSNHPNKAKPGALGDPAVADVYEPGSVNKVITFSGALEKNLITPDSPFTIPPTYTVAGRVFHDAEVHGTEHLTATGVLAQSSNIGTIQIAEKLGKDDLYSFLRGFGFGSVTGLGVPGESPGLLLPPNQWWGTTLPTVAFGQGVGVTAVQVASVYATIANGGVRVTPTLVAGTIGADGTLNPAPAPATRRVVSATTAKTVSDMLEAVTSDQGTAPAARISGYRVAGKTGTAHKLDGGTYAAKYVASFIGFAPASDPRLVVAVMIDEPSGSKYYGGDVAAPVFSKLMGSAPAWAVTWKSPGT